MVISIKNSPQAQIFGEYIGVVCFDEEGSKFIKDMNKQKKSDVFIRETPEQIDWFKNLSKIRNFILFMENIEELRSDIWLM